MPSSDDEAIRAGYTCKDCKAAKGEVCRYVLPAGYTPNPYSARSRALVERAGTPMKSVHLSRRQKYNRDYVARANARALERMKAQTPPWLLPLREFDKAENERMRAWLRSNWTLFRLRKVD